MVVKDGYGGLQRFRKRQKGKVGGQSLEDGENTSLHHRGNTHSLSISHFIKMSKKLVFSVRYRWQRCARQYSDI